MNIFNLLNNKDNRICIFTNGVLKPNGDLVMGAGMAKQAKDIFPELPSVLGKQIKIGGNHVYQYKQILSFPTKNHFKEKSDLELIKRSYLELSIIARLNKNLNYYLALPGTGLGQIPKETIINLRDSLNLPNNIITI